MERRNFITHATATLAGVAAAACGGSNAADNQGKPTFVFVHGAWHGGWCFSRVAQLLAEQGYQSLLVDLPGHGMQALLPNAYTSKPQNVAGLATEVSPLASITLDDYRNAVLTAIRGLVAAGSGPVILVGHSNGGVTIGAVAEAAPSLIRRLVYLTAFVPIKLPNALQYLLAEPNFAASQLPQLLVANPMAVTALRINFDSADPSYVAAMKSCFYHDVPDDRFAAIANLLTPDEPAGAPILAPVTLTRSNWGIVPRAFIRCTGDRAIPISGQDQMIAEADAFTPGNAFVQKTLNTSHSPFASAPAELVSTLTSLV
jgi:pimeloyl-ACP methyl ester carboxylesterase